MWIHIFHVTIAMKRVLKVHLALLKELANIFKIFDDSIEYDTEKDPSWVFLSIIVSLSLRFLVLNLYSTVRLGRCEIHVFQGMEDLGIFGLYCAKPLACIQSKQLI
jgi:hypothetical protein